MNNIKELCLKALRAEGRQKVKQRLEVLVNSDIIGLAGAQKIYKDAFGGKIVGVKRRFNHGM